MQAVPSLVGTGTAVAAAAAGLVFGERLEPLVTDMPPPSRPQKRRTTIGRDTRIPPTSSRPSTSAVPPSPAEDISFASLRFNDAYVSSITSQSQASSHPPQASSTHTTPPKPTSRRPSFVRQREPAARVMAESGRDSVSSRDSWIRRLSLRPMSQHGGSPRSSVIVDAEAGPFSPVSKTSTMSPTEQLSRPNVLVKRDAAVNTDKDATISLKRRLSRSRMPTLRRPATSHQRSATVQQFNPEAVFAKPLPAPQGPTEQQFSTDLMFVSHDTLANDAESGFGNWRSYFHSQTRGPARRMSPSRSREESPRGHVFSNRRLAVLPSSMSRAVLTKPSVITGRRVTSHIQQTPEKAPVASEDKSSPIDMTPSKGARRSISQHFSSPPSWASKTGSIRRAKRGSDAEGGKRYTSAPESTLSMKGGQSDGHPHVQENSGSAGSKETTDIGLSSNLQSKVRQRNSSSPLPPLSRLSSFNLDIPRLSRSGSMTGPNKPAHAPLRTTSGNPTSHPALSGREVSGDRTSTLASSEAGTRGFSGEDDDTDFRSETMFDSLRTIASSSRVRTVETPLGSLFDESPPSTGENGKSKRLSIQEMLGPSLDGTDRIMEEEEGFPTPVRINRLAEPAEVKPGGIRLSYESDSSSRRPSVVEQKLGWLSTDDGDIDDDDWDRENEDTLSNHLSPPSSTLNSRGVSPTLRHALASISGNGLLNRDSTIERPRSNVFDWYEPSGYDKFETDGRYPRPKTAHGKQQLDMRGGRAASRKGPGIAHVRSQSVPVVPDPTESAKTTPKFGTWGLGSKNASEDWDDDFDFDSSALPSGNKDSGTSFSMVVPASIQATQPTVKAHSGQIRELSLLVNDLKRLCRHGKDLGIVNGSSITKWRDAENIIALASPDEEETPAIEAAAREIAAGDYEYPSFDRASVEDRFLDEGFDAQSLAPSDAYFDVPEPEMGKTTVVKERQAVRRRSVFSPDDDIFGGWPAADEHTKPERPYTPEAPRTPQRDSAVISTVIEAMQQQRLMATPVANVPSAKPANTKLFFDTNSLQELVKRAGHLRDNLADVVRRAELLTGSPANTPRRERHSRLTSDGSPAFTVVFTDPAAPSTPKNLSKSHSTNTVLSKPSIDSPRLQIMTVS